MAQSKEYYAKLQDPRWQRKRLEIMQRADFKCEECGNDSQQLHVHHGFYRSGYEPWEYENHELLCLCSRCHGLVEAKLFDIRELIGCMTLDQLSRMFECANIIYHEVFSPPWGDKSTVTPEEALKFASEGPH